MRLQQHSSGLLRTPTWLNGYTTNLASHPMVLVIGGAGYIGSSLIRKLLASGKRVRVLDNLMYGDVGIRGVLGHPNLELQVGDCRSMRDVIAAVQGASSIVHLAAIVGDPACEHNKHTALETNYAATRMLIEIAKGFKISRLAFASSCSVYGATESLMTETSPVQPLSLYAETKVQSEQALLQAQDKDFHPAILRFSTVFGLSNRPRFDLVVNLLTARAYKEGVITIFNGEQWRPFIHVHDVAESITRVLSASIAETSGEIFNVGDNRFNHTLSQIATTICDNIADVHVDHVDSSDKRNYRVSFDKIRSRLGFESSISIRTGIHEIKHAFETRDITDYTDKAYNNHLFLKASGIPSHTSEVDLDIMAAFGHTFTPYRRGYAVGV